jgi:plastocyanin
MNGSGAMTMPMSARQQAMEQSAEIRQFAYQPKNVEVPVGTTVIWTNQDAIEHSVTASDGSFDSGLFTQGGTFSRTFDQPGTIAYVCSRHGSMIGEVNVIG